MECGERGGLGSRVRRCRRRGGVSGVREGCEEIVGLGEIVGKGGRGRGGMQDEVRWAVVPMEGHCAIVRLACVVWLVGWARSI